MRSKRISSNHPLLYPKKTAPFYFLMIVCIMSVLGKIGTAIILKVIKLKQMVDRWCVYHIKQFGKNSLVAKTINTLDNMVTSHYHKVLHFLDKWYKNEL